MLRTFLVFLLSSGMAAMGVFTIEGKTVSKEDWGKFARDFHTLQPTWMEQFGKDFGHTQWEAVAPDGSVWKLSHGVGKGGEYGEAKKSSTRRTHLRRHLDPVSKKMFTIELYQIEAHSNFHYILSIHPEGDFEPSVTVGTTIRNGVSLSEDSAMSSADEKTGFQVRLLGGTDGGKPWWKVFHFTSNSRELKFATDPPQKS